ALQQDPRLGNMLHNLQGKTNPQGQITAGSIWRAWKNLEFGQKKIPSRLITFLAHRILKRVPSI
ncbi:MAG: hypothetical protein K8R77_03105, partial [Anaerolineaceae bacterium]|nr:hypothetical protein [Anaerolineaceae bacterium]